MPRVGRIGDNINTNSVLAIAADKISRDGKKVRLKKFAENEPKLSVQNTKLSHAIPSVQKKFNDIGILNGEEKMIKTSNESTTSYVMCKLAIDKEGLYSGLVAGQKIPYFDLCVMNAMYTLWKRRSDKAKKECDLTYADIYRTMTGSTEKKKIKKSTLDQIEAAISRLSHIDATIDTRSEISEIQEKLKTHGIGAKGITIDALVSARRFITEARNHKTVTGNITLRDCPILCAYAEAMGQVVQLPYKVLDVRNADGIPKRKDEKFIAIQECLALHVASIRNSAIENHSIGIATIIQKIGYDYESEYRTTKKRDREAITEILEHYKRIGFITNFKINKENGLIYINA